MSCTLEVGPAPPALPITEGSFSLTHVGTSVDRFGRGPSIQVHTSPWLSLPTALVMYTCDNLAIAWVVSWRLANSSLSLC